MVAHTRASAPRTMQKADSASERRLDAIRERARTLMEGMEVVHFAVM